MSKEENINKIKKLLEDKIFKEIKEKCLTDEDAKRTILSTIENDKELKTEFDSIFHLNSTKKDIQSLKTKIEFLFKLINYCNFNDDNDDNEMITLIEPNKSIFVNNSKTIDIKIFNVELNIFINKLLNSIKKSNNTENIENIKEEIKSYLKQNKPEYTINSGNTVDITINKKVENKLHFLQNFISNENINLELMKTKISENNNKK